MIRGRTGLPRSSSTMQVTRSSLLVLSLSTTRDALTPLSESRSQPSRIPRWTCRRIASPSSWTRWTPSRRLTSPLTLLSMQSSCRRCGCSCLLFSSTGPPTATRPSPYRSADRIQGLGRLRSCLQAVSRIPSGKRKPCCGRGHVGLGRASSSLRTVLSAAYPELDRWLRQYGPCCPQHPIRSCALAWCVHGPAVEVFESFAYGRLH